MAVNLQDYVNSDAKVKAARAKLASANERVTKLTGVKLPGSVEALAKAKSDAAAAQSELDTAVQNAEDYFNANKEQIIAEEEKKQAGKEAEGKAAVERITKSGLLSESQVQAIEKTKRKPPVTKTAEGATTDNKSEQTGATVDTVNAQLAKLASPKQATNFISNTLDDAGRLLLAKTLKAAGYDVIETGTYNRGLVEAYQNALSDAQAENTFNKEVTGFKPYGTLTDYITYRTGLVNQAGGAGGPKTTTDIIKLTSVDAASYIESAFKSELNRKPTSEELAALVPAVKAYVKARAVKTTVSDKTRIATSGPAPVDWLTQVIRGQRKIVGFNLKNKGQAEKADAANKVISSLSTEYKKKEEQIVFDTSQEILKTVQANGLGRVIGKDQISVWANRIKNGESIGAINNEIRTLAKTGMPDTVKKLMDAGMNLDAIYGPYRQIMASMLEINPETIPLDDSALRMAIGPDGEMSLYDFERTLRQDPRWQYTDNARQEVSTAILNVLQDFGFQGA